MESKYKVDINLLKKKCNTDSFSFKTTKEITESNDIIGQKRAMKAIKFGLSIKRKGYNIFVSGISGTGRNTYSYSIASEFSKKMETPDDWCYVYNFIKPVNPRAIPLEMGRGKILRNEIENLIEKLKIDVPKVFSSKEYEDRKKVIYEQFEKKTEEIIDKLNDIAKDYDFEFTKTEKGLITYPLIDGRPMKEEELEDLSEEELVKLKEKSNKLNSEAYEVIKEFKNLEILLRNRIKQLNEKVAFDLVDFHLNSVLEVFKDNKHVESYLNEMEDDIIKNIEEFMDINSEDKKKDTKKNFFKRYEVNLFIDNNGKKGAPVIREINPNYYNLLGKIEYINEHGALKTDHTMIKPGALHEANGGFLIIQAKDILSKSYAWEGLKRTLVGEEIKIENITKGSVLAQTIKPEAIPINLKVIIVGDYHTYQLLYNYDEDFKKLFRIRADFDIEMKRHDDNIEKIASFVASHCKGEKLKPFHKTAISEIVEYSSRLAESQLKLTSRFNEIVEIMYEADAFASVKGDEIVKREHIIEAIEEKIYRNNKYEEKLHELFKDGTLLMETSGFKIGQINGLAVMDSGQYSFGRPNKITVSTFVGKDGIVNLEREVEQSGNIHDKGVLILSGYLGEKYATEKPLSLSASITFEQSYDMIDGDSASSTELYALLSSLSEKPINQAIAVTGSVNQKGMIQPIGGANEKIEGFYKVCKLKGFKGGEGVIIPKQNIKNLMLKDEIIKACKEGIFNIYAVESIDEGIEILTGIKAGKPDENGYYKKNTINYLVKKKLDKFAALNRDYN
ncbi:MAG: ATP-dependent protease [Firmicutes bacterium]|nr:ATP-dependent protease [Bacillota bacterium]